MVILFFWFTTLAAGWYFLQLADLLIFDANIREYNSGEMSWDRAYRARDRQRVCCALILSSAVLLYTALCCMINWLGWAGFSLYFYCFQLFLILSGLTAYLSRVSVVRFFARPISGPRLGQAVEVERIWGYLFGFELVSLALCLLGPLLVA